MTSYNVQWVVKEKETHDRQSADFSASFELLNSQTSMETVI